MTNVTTLPLSPTRRVGDLLFLSGQLSLDKGVIVGADVATQTDRVIDAIAQVLAAHGLDLGDVVRTGVWLTDAKNFPAFNAAYASRFEAPYPCRSTVVSALALPGALVEIDAVAAFGQ